jgi:hypothetical protein
VKWSDFLHEPEEPGLIQGASRILLAAQEDADWELVGEAVKASINRDVSPPIEPPWQALGGDGIAELQRWNHIIKVTMIDENWINDVLSGHPRQLGQYKMCVAFDTGDPDPFYDKPPRGGWRAALSWIWQSAIYPTLLELGRRTPPRKTIYIINNLALEPVQAPPIASSKDEWSHRFIDEYRHTLRFRGVW